MQQQQQQMNNNGAQPNWNPMRLPNHQYEIPSVIKKQDIPLGKHLQQCGGTSFIIYDYYMTNKIIGNGSFGIVAAATDTRTGKQVAIKKVKNAFRDLVDAKRILREIKLLMFLKHNSIISLIDIVSPDGENFEDVYLIFELMQTDLEKVINSKQKLSDNHVKFFMQQILASIHFIHSADVIHRDLKPSNLFVNKNCGLKVGDLNLARKFENFNYITEYVVTRWYRAPEILLSQAEYKKAIDIWSIGCIFAELMIRCPLFKGEHFLNQIECIVAVLGTPSEEDFPYKVNETSMRYIKQLPAREKIPFTELFPSANPLAIDLLSKMLVFNPDKRYTAEQCLQHEYFSKDNINLKTCEGKFDWEFDNIPLKKELIQKEMYEAIQQFIKENGTEYKPSENKLLTQNQGEPTVQSAQEMKFKHQQEQLRQSQMEQMTVQQQQQFQMQQQIWKQQQQQQNSFQKQMQEMRNMKQQILENKEQQKQQQQQNQSQFQNLLQQQQFFQQMQKQFIQQQQQSQQNTPTLPAQSGNNNSVPQQSLLSNQSQQFPRIVEKHMSFSDNPNVNNNQNNNKDNGNGNNATNNEDQNNLENEASNLEKQQLTMQRNFSFSMQPTSKGEQVQQQQQQQSSQFQNSTNQEKQQEDQDQKEQENEDKKQGGEVQEQEQKNQNGKEEEEQQQLQQNKDQQQEENIDQENKNDDDDDDNKDDNKQEQEEDQKQEQKDQEE